MIAVVFSRGRWRKAVAHGRLAPCAAAAALLSLLPACSPYQTGDFGRRADNVYNNVVLPQAGITAAWSRGEAVSLYPFTDDEIEMRDRAWRFLMPAHDKANMQQRLAELSYSRVLPPLPHSGLNSYFLLLMAEDYRSVASRYNKIGQDIEADRLLMVPFSQAAARVCAADRVRILSLNRVGHLDPIQREQAVIRVAENRGLIDWVRRDMRQKVAAYRYALEHVTIEAPMPEAIRAEQALIALESAQLTLDYWDGCGEAGSARPPGARPHGVLKDSERFAPASPADVKDKRGAISNLTPK
ncbi:MAG: hypothetical protein IOC90_13715 [Methylocystis sp.]|nr:hypothetical protein [Methylocystis sp.]MCA3582538.1 hypothetical protein [Methylocystis sp.]MCA3589071.1 hypothetical protein [Methylocystis sp.]MCA3591789.1 hypothetical protein [Methylocystis sp.]